MTAASTSKTKGAKGKASDEKKRRNASVRTALFIRQIFAELKKVQQPTHEELRQMFSTVFAFVTIIMIVVGLLDFGFGRLTFWVFGQPLGPRTVSAVWTNEQKVAERGWRYL